MKLSELITKLQAVKDKDGDIQVQFTEDLAPLMGISAAKVPAMYAITTLFYPRLEPDGSFVIPGREELTKLVTESLNESLHGMDGNILTMVGYTGATVKYTPQPSPIIPQPVPAETAPWWATLKKGSVVVNKTPGTPIDMYEQPRGNVAGQLKVAWEMKLTEDPQLDAKDKTLGWLRVSDKLIQGKPMYWLQSTAVKAK